MSSCLATKTEQPFCSGIVHALCNYTDAMYELSSCPSNLHISVVPIRQQINKESDVRLIMTTVREEYNAHSYYNDVC